ncbi:SGNH/GDSL hydrolase family protein [Thalassotalea eurytherma]|uniref:SGNH hydrolase-type esterase domain-containing protein n=1 Tax=Thalassotalea eurytherma TaxID=1144278 RepID=A0ABQ6H0P9_9GAMM|nr:SGNH/GDSL hydrolase family protein [Thalassotalea eurytherma]GLX81672.1 hypothetical protein theurythT_11240 [Thalassotalea eurytherma]
MSHFLVTLALLPALIIQGKYVRKKTPKLPEPIGERILDTHKDPLLNVLILGDSAAAGVGVSYQSDGLLGQLKSSTNTAKVNYTLMASTGATTKDTLNTLSNLAQEQYHVVITSLGVNDVTKGLSRNKFRQQQAALYQDIINRFKPRLIIATHIPPMHKFPALPQPLRWYVGRRAKQLNQDLLNISRQFDCVKTLAIELPETPELMAKDGFHPGKPVYQEWAENAAKLIDAIQA